MYHIPNSFAAEYFGQRFKSGAWETASSGDRTKAVNTAEIVIDAMFTFPEGTFTEDENGTLTATNARIPAAICEEALWLLTVDPTEYPALLTLGLASAGASGATAVLDKDMIAPLVVPIARQLIGQLGDYYDAAAENGQVVTMPLQNEW